MKREGNVDMGRFVVTVNLANFRDRVLADAGSLTVDQVRAVTWDGVVDSGASHLVLPKKVAAKLGVPVVGKTRVRYADQRKALRDVVESVEVQLLGRRGTFKAVVEPKRKDVLVGAIVLEDLDLLVDCRARKLRPRDPRFIIAELE